MAVEREVQKAKVVADSNFPWMLYHRLELAVLHLISSNEKKRNDTHSARELSNLSEPHCDVCMYASTNLLIIVLCLYL